MALPSLPDMNDLLRGETNNIIKELEEEKDSEEMDFVDEEPDFGNLDKTIPDYEPKNTFVNRDTVIADDGGEFYEEFSSNSSNEDCQDNKQVPMWEFDGLLSQLQHEDADVCRAIKSDLKEKDHPLNLLIQCFQTTFLQELKPKKPLFDKLLLCKPKA